MMLDEYIDKENPMINENSRLTFGKHKGKKLKDCPNAYLTWMGKELRDTDFHAYAVVAKKLAEDKNRELKDEKDLDKAADEFLRQHGINPKNL